MTNFKGVLNKNSIKIPIIQRDYAQGRKDKKVTEIRDTFLDSIADRLAKNKKLHLDFVYGSIKNKVFIPLDGQQRLTTLFLLYWYFGKKEKRDIEFLEKFTYETRASSREFCQKLIKNNDFNFSNKNLVSDIKDSAWFLSFWENDPTIKSMLRMIESIHQKFHNNNFFEELDNITFEFFELEKFGLDDDLYIKMNARGKALTEFENFKAKFEQFLEKKDIDLKREFEEKIDNQWTDFFWKYKNDSYLIDEVFMNYFYYITEMLTYKKVSTLPKQLDEISFKLIEDIYSDTKNIKFLFKSLDRLQNILDTFSTLFSQYSYQKNKVALFDKDINFVEQVISKGINGQGSIGIQKKFILFMVISYLVENDEISMGFKDFIRVVRNIIEKIRNLKKAQLQYTPNFEYREFHRYVNLFLKYINKNIYKELEDKNNDWSLTKEFNQEIEKAKLININIEFKETIFELEDYKYLKGDIHNFLDEDINKMKIYVNSIPKIFNNSNDTLIIRAMLTTGDCRLSKGGTRKVGHRYFFGKDKLWEIFLTDNNSIEKDFFKKFIEKYTEYGENLQKLIDDYDFNQKNWIYYFIKYKEILEKDTFLSKDENFFAWYNDFEIEKMGGLRIDAFHINPYIRVVAIKTKNENYLQYKKEEKSYLSIDGFIDEMCSKNISWSIKFTKNINPKIKKDIIDKFSLKEEKNPYILEVKDEDRIELAIKFIQYIESWQSK